MGSERRDTALVMLVTPTEAERLRELMWSRRRALSGWLRELALEGAERLEQTPAHNDAG
jgi:hypothetical protein